MIRELLSILGIVVTLVIVSAGQSSNADRTSEMCAKTLPEATSLTKAEYTNAPPVSCEEGTKHSVRLSWKPSADVLSSEGVGGARYRVYRWEKDGACQKMSKEPVEAAYEDCEVQPGHTYRYAVTAVKGSHESEPTNVVEAFIRSP
jgi:fibronectin type 3 domain-containing protein